MTPIDKDPLHFLSGGGTMGNLIRLADWSGTAMGPPGSWPACLKTIVGMILRNPIPMYIAWGKDFTQLYNEAMIEILADKHPAALGIGCDKTFAEAWDVIGPMFKRVIQGESIRYEDFVVNLVRNGKPEPCHFSFSYSPIILDDGTIGGILATVVETTAINNTAAALKESEERFRTMAEATDILIATADQSSNATYFNKAWTELTGCPMEELLEFGWVNLVHPEDREPYLKTYLDAFEKKVSFSGEFRVLGKHGAYRWLLAKAPPLFRPDGSFAGYICSFVDITDKMDALKNLEASKGVLQDMVGRAPLGICIIDATTLVCELVNNSFLEVAGKPYEAIAGRHYWDSFAEVREYYEPALKEVIDQGIPYFANEVKMTLIRYGKPEDIYVTFVYSPLKGTNGTVDKVAIWVIENTTQVAAREAVREAEEKTRLAIRSASLGVYEAYYKTNVVITDFRFKQITGTDDTITFGGLAKLVHPDDLKMREQAHQVLADTGQLDYQARLVAQDNTSKWVRITGRLIRDDMGEKEKLIGMIQDVNAEVTAQLKIAESERNIRSMILQAPVAMAIFRGSNHIVEIANRAMLEIWGRTANDIIGQPIFEGLPEAKGQGLEKQLADVMETGERFIANERPVDLHRNGTLQTLYINFVYEPLYDGEGVISGVLAVASNVTAQVSARHKIEELVSERTRDLAEANAGLKKSNAELAQFAYIASHDLQEPLRKISTFSQMLENSLELPISEKAQDYLGKIRNSAMRMTKLIKDVLSYSELGKESAPFEPTDLNEIAGAVISDYELLIEQRGVKIICDELPTIDAIPLQMSQLFSNMIGNALKFYKPDTAPILRITATQADKADLETISLDPSLKYLKLRFQDNGIGIDPNYTEQIFKIFQRLHNKTQYEGTGIGLAMCRKIALNHHGEINATESDADGAVFNVYLPFSQL